jgi:hypothetical protein
MLNVDPRSNTVHLGDLYCIRARLVAMAVMPCPTQILRCYRERATTFAIKSHDAGVCTRTTLPGISGVPYTSRSRSVSDGCEDTKDRDGLWKGSRDNAELCYAGVRGIVGSLRCGRLSSSSMEIKEELI